MIDFPGLLALLADGRVDYVIVGGLAATIHGSSRLTQDLDVVYDRTDGNLQRLADALRAITPYLPGAPPGLPFEWSPATLRRGLNFTLTTSLGDLELPALIRAKRAAGRLRDLEAAAELEALLEERRTR